MEFKDNKMEVLLKMIINLSRPQKRLVTLLIDFTFIVSAFWLSLMVGLDSFTPIYVPVNWLLLLIVLSVSLLAFIKLGLYRAVLRYINSQALWTVVTGSFVATFTMTFFSLIFNMDLPLVVPVIFNCFCFC